MEVVMEAVVLAADGNAVVEWTAVLTVTVMLVMDGSDHNGDGE